VPDLLFNPQDPAFVEDPYPTYGLLRERDPVHRTPWGYWVLSRYADVYGAFDDPRLSNEPSTYAVVSRRNLDRYVSAEVAANILPFMDPPRHTIPRRLIHKAFHAHLTVRPPDIESIADRLLDARRAQGDIDLLSQFGTPLSARVIGEVIGIPASDLDRLKAWSELFFYLFNPIPSEEILHRMEQGLAEFRLYLAGLIMERRGRPSGDLISALIDARADGRGLSDEELTDNLMLLFADGVENIDSALGNILITLLGHPLEMERLKAQPELLPAATVECLRLESPVHLIGRIPIEDMTIGGRQIRRSEPVLLALASANRDPSQFPDPDRLDLSRKRGADVVFGRGRHACIGDRLVEAEVHLGLKAILTKLENLRLKDAGPRRVMRFGHRWLGSLPVSFEPY
jgi:cytochrome P450